MQMLDISPSKLLCLPFEKGFTPVWIEMADTILRAIMELPWLQLG